MDSYKIEGLLVRLSLLREHSQALLEQAADFPALQCNCRRALASLQMMEMDLGLLTLPLESKPSGQN